MKQFIKGLARTHKFSSGTVFFVISCLDGLIGRTIANDCRSPISSAVDLLKANPDKINWRRLSENPAAIELLQANPDKIDWDCLTLNPVIFKIIR